MMTLLEKVRKLSSMLQNAEDIDIQELAALLSEVENANVYCANEKGMVLGYQQLPQCLDEEKLVAVAADKYFPELYTRYLNNVIKTVAEPAKEEGAVKNTIIVPIYSGHKRLGSLVIELLRKDAKNDDLVLAEFAATVLGVAITRINNYQAEQIKMVMVALETLSYSETAAVKAILGSLNGLEGYLVASKIADKEKLTRSVIVNALRKLESAGVIETRSLGMKGTFIRILVPLILDELK